MKLPLLVGACPRLVTGTPKVRLYSGSWSIVVEGYIDSDLVLYNNGHCIPLAGEILIVGPTEVQVEFAKKGSEKVLSIYAELQPSLELENVS